MATYSILHEGPSEGVAFILASELGLLKVMVIVCRSRTSRARNSKRRNKITFCDVYFIKTFLIASGITYSGTSIRTVVIKIHKIYKSLLLLLSRLKRKP